MFNKYYALFYRNVRKYVFYNKINQKEIVDEMGSDTL